MKTKPAFSRSSSTSLTYTHKSSVRSLPETKECFAVDLSLNSNGTQVAVLTVPTTIQLFDASTLKYVTSLSSTSNTFDINQSSGIKISSIQFTYVSPHTLFAATNKNLVLGWDMRTPQQEIFQLDGCVDEHKFLSVTCNNDDHLVAAGSELKGEENVGIGFWDLRASRQKELLGYYTESHSDDIIQVQFCRMNTNRLISGSTDGLVCLYDISKPNEEDALEQVMTREEVTVWTTDIPALLGLQCQWTDRQMWLCLTRFHLCHNIIQHLLSLVHIRRGRTAASARRYPQ